MRLYKILSLLILFYIPFGVICQSGYTDHLKIKQLRTDFNAILEVKAITITKQFDFDGNLESKTESENNYSVNQVISFNDVLFDRLEKKVQNLNYCDSRGGCVLLNGNSYQEVATPANPVGNLSLSYSFSSEEYNKCDGKLILSRTSKGDGITSDYRVTTMVSIYKFSKAEEEIALVPLVKNKASMDDIKPVPLTNANHFAQMSIQVGYFHPAPPIGTSKKYNCDTKKWENSNETYGFSLPDFIEREKAVNQNGYISSYINPVIPENELMSYLRNPSGMKRFEIKARSYKKEANAESQTDYYITLTLF